MCIRFLDGTNVMTTAEYSLWRDELGRQDGDCLFDALRRHLAKRFSVAFRYLIFLSISLLGVD